MHAILILKMQFITKFRQGQNFNVIKVHSEAMSLQEAKEKIKTPKALDSQYRVHKFRDVMPKRDINKQLIQELFETNKEDFKQLSLVKLVEGVYVQIIEPFTGDKEAVYQEITRRPNIPLRASTVEMGKVMDEHIKDLAAGKFGKVIYGANLQNLPKDMSSSLEDIVGTISADRLGDLIGINRSTLYLSSAGSLSVLHHEDGMLPALNGELDGAAKLWIFINTLQNRVLGNVLLQEIRGLKVDLEKRIKKEKNPTIKREMKDLVEDLSEWKEGCSDPVGHKKLVITTEFLDKHEIGYQMLVQTGQDLVFSDAGVYHQVFNLGISFNEAINRGGAQWNHMAHLYLPCTCSGSQVVAIEADEKIACVSKEIKRKSHACDKCHGCTFGDKRTLEIHKKIHADNTFAPYVCVLCHNTYVYAKGLQQHIKRKHLGEVPSRKTTICDICGDVSDTSNISRHKRAHRLPNGEIHPTTVCPGCLFQCGTLSAFSKHIKLCPRVEKSSGSEQARC